MSAFRREGLHILDQSSIPLIMKSPFWYQASCYTGPRLLWSHLKDCPNPVAFYDKQVVLKTNVDKDINWVVILKVFSLSSTSFHLVAMSHLSFHFHVDSYMPKFEFYASQTGDRFVFYMWQFLFDEIIYITWIIFELKLTFCILLELKANTCISDVDPLVFAY